MMRTQTTRAGITLTEVLVALFIMAIGMIALLVMFPLGAQQIAQAIKDERSAQAANNADNILRDHWREYVIKFLKAGGTEAQLVNPASPFSLHYMTAMENPNLALGNDVTPSPLIVQPNRAGIMPAISDPATWQTTGVNVSRPSYPVFISPYGEVSRRGAGYVQSRRWVGGVRPADNTAANPTAVGIGVNQPRVPRRTLNFPTTTPVVFETQNRNWQFRFCTLADDIDFSEDGAANQGTSVSRSGRYNWDWVVQRPAQGNRLTMNLSVVVYDQRSYGNPRPDDEIAYTIPANINLLAVGGSEIRIPYNTNTNPPTVIPAVRAGQWIMDGTVFNDPAGANNIRNANFYRVTAVTDVPNTAVPGQGQLRLDLQTPIKIPAGTTLTTGQAYPGPAHIYILRGVAEVIERRPLTNEDTPVVP